MTDNEYRLIRRKTVRTLGFGFMLVIGVLAYAVYAVNDARESSERARELTEAKLACRSDLAAEDDAAQGDVLVAIGQALTDAVTGVDPKPAIARFVEANNRMQAAQAARAEQTTRCP